MSEVGRLWVSIGARTDEFQRGLTGVQARLQTASTRLNTFGRSMTRYVTLPAIAAGAGILALAVKTGNFADELLDLSAASGISTDSLQRFRYMASAAGTETDSVATSILYMTRQMQDLETFSRRVEDVAKAYNVQLRDMEGNVRNVEDVHYDLMLAIAAIEDPQERAAAGAQAFGRQWENIAPIIDLGTEAIERFAEQEVISREKLEMANKFREAWDGITHTLGIIAMEVGIELIETLNEMFDLSPENLREQMAKLRDTIMGVVEKVQDWINWWHELDPTMQDFYKKAGLLILILGPTSRGLAGVLTLVSAGLKLLAGVKAGSFAAASASAGAAAAPGAGLMIFLGKLGLIAAAIWAIIEAIRILMRRMRELNAMTPEQRFDQSMDMLQQGPNAPTLPPSLGSGIGMYDTGGIVPGPIGKPQLAVVHGGETILPTHKTGQTTAGRVASELPNLGGKLAMIIVDDHALKKLHRQLKSVGYAEEMRYVT